MASGHKPIKGGITYAALKNMKAGRAGAGGKHKYPVGSPMVDEMGNHMINQGNILGCIDEPIADIHDYDYSMLLSPETKPEVRRMAGEIMIMGHHERGKPAAGDLAAMFNTILGDWAMMEKDGPAKIKRVGPDGREYGSGDGVGKELAITNYWVVEDVIIALHCPRYAGLGKMIREHIKLEHWKPDTFYGRYLVGVNREYWNHFKPLVLERAAKGYKGVG